MIMGIGDEEFDGKYVTVKAVARYGVVSSAILAVTIKETDDGEFYVQYAVQ